MKNKHPKLTFLLCCLLSASYSSFCWSVGEKKEGDNSVSEPESAAVAPLEEPKPIKPAIKKRRTSAKKKHPQLLLQDVRKQLIRYDSIRCDIKQTVAIGDRIFRAEGTYLQGTNLRLRLEFAVVINQKQKGTLLQVCEGDVLFTQLQIGKEKPRVTRRSVLEILKAADDKDELSQNMLVAQLGLGGLPALMSSIERNMVFDAMKEETIDGTDFVVLQGHWNDKFLKRWRESNTEEDEGETEAQKEIVLPMRIPDLVRIYCNRQTLFPQRILYLKKHPEKKRYRQMVVLDFKNIQLDGHIDKQEFQFVPPDGVNPEDDTKRYLELLRKSKRQRARAEQKNALAPQQQP